MTREEFNDGSTAVDDYVATLTAGIINETNG
jgi:hypothetical protein